MKVSEKKGGLRKETGAGKQNSIGGEKVGAAHNAANFCD